MRELHNAVIHIPEDKREIFEAASKRVKDDAVIRLIDSILCGKSVAELRPEEIRAIIHKVKKEMPASIRQLSSILRVSKEFVRRTIRLAASFFCSFWEDCPSICYLCRPKMQNYV